jgi:O-antigen biosynthesis protein
VGHLENGWRPTIDDDVELRIDELSTRLARLKAQLEHECADNALERRVLAESVVLLEERLSRVENSVLFKVNRAIGNFARSRMHKISARLHHPALDILRLPARKLADEQYARWVELQEASYSEAPCRHESARRWSWCPTFSILLVTRDPQRERLARAVKSVQKQSYDNWTLCICDDASRESWVAEYLRTLAQSDPRVQASISLSRRGIAESFNAAAALADSDFIAHLPQDGTLHEHCLFYVGEACQRGSQVIYVDEDRLDGSGRRGQPLFKPDWSPDLLTSCMYWGRFWFFERKAAQGAAGTPEHWFRPSFEGAEEYDLALRLTDEPLKVEHIPRILYHSQSSDKTENGVRRASKNGSCLALEDTLRRRGWSGTVESAVMPGTFFVHRKFREHPVVSIIVCSRKLNLFETFLRRLKELTNYDSLELVLVEHQVGAKCFPLERLRRTWKKPLVHVPFTGSFNFSTMNNRGVQAASGNVLIFLNDDVEPISPDWLDHMLGQVQRPEVGIVGARLDYPSGAIQHAGIALGMSLDGAGHPGRFLFRSNLFPWLEATRNVSAVTGACLGIRRSLYEELRGMDPQFPVDYNDVDLCLRARERGYLVVYEAAAVMRHRESASRSSGSHFRERGLFHRRWANLLEQPDPYVPIAIERRTEAIRLAQGTLPEG